MPAQLIRLLSTSCLIRPCWNQARCHCFSMLTSAMHAASWNAQTSLSPSQPCQQPSRRSIPLHPFPCPATPADVCWAVLQSIQGNGTLLGSAFWQWYAPGQGSSLYSLTTGDSTYRLAQQHAGTLKG